MAPENLRRPIITLTTFLMGLSFLFSSVALSGASLNSNTIIASPWWYFKLNGNPVGASFYGLCVKTYEHGCDTSHCKALVAKFGAPSTGTTSVANGINNRYCGAYETPGGTSLLTPTGFLYQYDSTSKCAFYSESMATLAILTWILCILKFFHTFSRREQTTDSLGRKNVGLALLFLAFWFGVISLAIFGNNCGPPMRKLTHDLDEDWEGRFGAGAVCMVMSVMIWGICFICEAVVPAGTGTMCNLGNQQVPAGSKRLVNDGKVEVMAKASTDGFDSVP